MNPKSAAHAFSEFVERFNKILTGQIIPGRNECKPPYDSEWEREFEWVLAKQIPDFFVLRNQVHFGRHRVDFTFECTQTNRVWIIEFDGKTYHNWLNDRRRDDEILSDFPLVQAIVRVDASTGHLEFDETRAMLSQILPECFKRQFEPFHDWSEDAGVFTARVFDQREDEDSWRSEGGLMDGAPMIDLQIEVRRRPA